MLTFLMILFLYISFSFFIYFTYMIFGKRENIILKKEDGWIGFYFDKRKRILYIFLIPFIGMKIPFTLNIEWMKAFNKVQLENCKISKQEFSIGIDLAKGKDSQVCTLVEKSKQPFRFITSGVIMKSHYEDGMLIIDEFKINEVSKTEGK